MEKRYHLAIWTADPATDPTAKQLRSCDAWEIAKLRSLASSIAKPGQYVEIIDSMGSNGESWTVPAADPQPEETAAQTPAETAKEEHAMSTATETATRTYHTDAIETAGRTYSCTYRTEDNGAIIADLATADGAPLAVVIPQDHPDHAAAKAAAEAAGAVQPEAAPAEVCTDEAPAAPAPIVKPWAGETITGNGWRIVFDSATARTRVIFDAQPAEEVKKAVSDAGFYWSAVMQSWNKGLTCKARRAAEKLAATLADMIPAAV